MRRVLTFLGGFLGVFGFFLINTSSSYSMATGGYVSLISYFGPALIIAGLVYWPILYTGYSVYDSVRWRFFLFALQVGSFFLYIYLPQTPLLQGFAAGIMFSPFWCAYHVAMVQNTTSENRGFEITLSLYINALATVLGALTAGYLLDSFTSKDAAILSMTSLILGTLCFSFSTSIKRQHKKIIGFIRECKEVARDNPYISRRIISESLFEIPTFTIAALMFVMGLSPISMGIVLAGRVLVLSFTSPLIGHIAHKHRKHSYSIGLTICGLAWLILAIDPTLHVLYFISLILLGLGRTFSVSGLMSGVYEMQNYSSMMWTEFYLGVGRLLGLTLILPILFYNAYYYLFILAGLSFITFIMNKRWQKRWATENTI